jgi:hypothetical protein
MPATHEPCGRLWRYPGGGQIEHKLEPGWLLDGQIGRFFAPENAADINASQATGIGEARSVAHQAAGLSAAQRKKPHETPEMTMWLNLPRLFRK